jgi:hypothetical protein
MTDSITPPPELVQQWWTEAVHSTPLNTNADTLFASRAAQWGADQELKACCDWFQDFYKLETWMERDLKAFRAARRPTPKPPETIEVDGFTYRLVQ